jgi:hypothetical protein
MTESFPTRLLLLLARATPEQLATIDRFLSGEPLSDTSQGVLRSPGQEVRENRASQAGAKGDPAYVFRKKGSLWEVVFDGGDPFFLEDTLRARYLDYLLHHPNEPIPAFDLEVAVQPEKGEARNKTSVQPESDPRAKREYRQALRRLQAARYKAQTTGDQEEVQRLSADIKALESALRGGCEVAGTGERARDNMRKALRAVIEHLAKGDRKERAFAEHLESRMSTGYECLYSQQPHRCHFISGGVASGGNPRSGNLPAVRRQIELESPALDPGKRYDEGNALYRRRPPRSAPGLVHGRPQRGSVQPMIRHGGLPLMVLRRYQR